MIELFYEVRAIANIKGWLSGEYFSVDDTLIQATAEHKSLEHRDGSDDDGANIKGKTHCNGKHASTTERDARLCRKYNTARLETELKLQLLYGPTATWQTAGAENAQLGNSPLCFETA